MRHSLDKIYIAAVGLEKMGSRTLKGAAALAAVAIGVGWVSLPASAFLSLAPPTCGRSTKGASFLHVDSPAAPLARVSTRGGRRVNGARSLRCSTIAAEFDLKR